VANLRWSSKHSCASAEITQGRAHPFNSVTYAVKRQLWLASLLCEVRGQHARRGFPCWDVWRLEATKLLTLAWLDVVWGLFLSCAADQRNRAIYYSAREALLCQVIVLQLETCTASSAGRLGQAQNALRVSISWWPQYYCCTRGDSAQVGGFTALPYSSRSRDIARPHTRGAEG
jgi:hypothetical protein